MNRSPTKERSEELFQEYCRSRGYLCSRIETSNVRTPDFEVLANGTRIVAETKDLCANKDDIRNWRATRKGEILVHSREPGKRARYLIKNARGQLRSYK